MVGRQRQKVALVAISAMAVVVLAACGTSPRDEYMRIRGINVSPLAGDGSTIASMNFGNTTALGSADDSLAMKSDMPDR